MTPAWTPLTEPRTVIVPSCWAPTPRNAICVCGEATRLPAIGNTLTAGPLWAIAGCASPSARPHTSAIDARDVDGHLIDMLHPSEHRRRPDGAGEADRTAAPSRCYAASERLSGEPLGPSSDSASVSSRYCCTEISPLASRRLRISFGLSGLGGLGAAGSAGRWPPRTSRTIP